MVRDRQMWPLPFWKITRKFQSPISDLLNCSPDLSDSKGRWDPGTRIEAFKHLSGLTALSVPVWSFPVMFMQLLHSSTVYPPAALHSLFCIYVLWPAYFAWTFLDLPSVFSAGSHTRSINFPCCQPASHQKLSTWLPGEAWGTFVLPPHFSSLGGEQRLESSSGWSWRHHLIPLTAFLRWAKDIVTAATLFLAILSCSAWVCLWFCFCGRP